MKWSDGGAQSHTIVASSSIPLYRADFALAYTVSAGVYPAQTGYVSVAPASSNGYFPNNSTVSLDAAAVHGLLLPRLVWTHRRDAKPRQIT